MRLAVVCVVVWAGTVRGDELKHPSGFTFELPQIAKAWEKQTKGDLIIVNDETDKLPELEVFAFPPRKDGTPEDIEARFASELPRPGVTLAGEAIKSVKVAQSATAKVADATVRSGVVTLNGGDKAAFAIVQRAGKSLILLGVPKPGIFERGQSNFRALVQSLKADASIDMPKLPTLAIIKEVTATSTFVDPKHKDAYAPRRVIDFGGQIPSTAWCEGKPDEGIGETVTITFAAPTQIDKLSIAAGVWKTQKLFTANNQITALDLTLDGKTTTLKPATTRTWLDVPVGRAISKIELKIAAVQKGRMNDSCISGVRFERASKPIEHLTGIDGAALAELPRAIEKIEAALSAPNRAALQQVIDFPFTLNDAGDFFYSAHKPFKYANWKAVEAACKAQDKLAAKGKEITKTTCPGPASFDSADDREARIGSPGANKLEIAFPSHREVLEVWRLKWRDGAWRLTAIDYEGI